MLSRELVKEALRRALSTGADYAEVFAEHTRSKNINIFFFITNLLHIVSVFLRGRAAFQGLFPLLPLRRF